jgi:hypothetical protein
VRWFSDGCSHRRRWGKEKRRWRREEGVEEDARVSRGWIRRGEKEQVGSTATALVGDNGDLTLCA